MSKTARICIVDDDLSVRNALARLCKSAGYRVDSFESAEDFLETLASEVPDCLILDVHLPGSSGLKLQTDLGAAHRSYPIIFMTAYEEDESVRAAALESGAVECLRKPLDSQQLLDIIREALESRDL